MARHSGICIGSYSAVTFLEKALAQIYYESGIRRRTRISSLDEDIELQKLMLQPDKFGAGALRALVLASID